MKAWNFTKNKNYREHFDNNFAETFLNKNSEEQQRTL